MSAAETVTFSLPSGAKVTAPLDLARRLGWQESQPPPLPKPRRTRKTTK